MSVPTCNHLAHARGWPLWRAHHRFWLLILYILQQPAEVARSAPRTSRKLWHRRASCGSARRTSSLLSAGNSVLDAGCGWCGTPEAGSCAARCCRPGSSSSPARESPSCSPASSASSAATSSSAAATSAERRTDERADERPPPSVEEARDDLRDDLPTEGRGGQRLSRPAARRMAQDGRVHEVWVVFESE